MKTYTKTTFWSLLAAVLFTIISLVNYLGHQYLMAVFMMALTSLWLVSFYLNRRPYLTLDQGKLVVARGLFKPKEFMLADLKISKIDKGSVELIHHGKDKVSILLTVMNKKNAQEFLQDLQKSLKKKEK